MVRLFSIRASMFEFFRSHTRALQFILVLLIFPSFVFLGVQGYSGFGGQQQVVAEVAGHKITNVELESSLRERVERVVFAETTTIGLRVQEVDKVALDRGELVVLVDGHPVRVKIATRGGEVVNRQPEHADVVAAARASGRAVKDVLAEAAAAARVVDTRD